MIEFGIDRGVHRVIAMIWRCLTKYLKVRLPSVVNLGKMFVSSNVEVFAMEQGD